MLDFVYYAPTRYIFGRTAMDHLARALQENHAQRVLLVHYGEESPPLPVGRTRKILKESGFEYKEFTGIRPNPLLSRILEGIEFCREYKPDLILAVGGASVIDTAKSIAAGVKLNQEEDLWEDYIFPKNRFKASLPVGVVLTLPAAGSEMSFGLCVTNDKTREKRYTGGECLIPKFCIANPEFTFTLPPYQTACGVFDIFSHLNERYFVPYTDVDLSDRMIEAIMRSVLIHGAVLVKEPHNYESRAQIMWAGTIAHNKILEMGRTHGDWASHDIAHELSGFYDMAHGSSLAVITPAWMKYVYKHAKPKFLQYARRVFDVDYGFDKENEAIEEMIKRLEGYIRSLSLPLGLKEAGVKKSDFAAMAESAMRGRTNVGTGNGIYLLGKEDIINVYNLAY